MDGNDCLSDLPPSAKLVFKVLEYDGPMTQKQLVEESMLSARTVRYALERLEDCGHVDERVYFADARQSLYELTEAVAGDATNPESAPETPAESNGETASESNAEPDPESNAETAQDASSEGGPERAGAETPEETVSEEAASEADA